MTRPIQDLPERLHGLLDHMQSQRFRECLDPRDKIYGFLGLTIELGKPFMLPAYSLPPHVIYREFALKFIRQTKDLNIFSLVAPWRSSSLYATWAPDWAQKTSSGVNTTIDLRFSALSSFQASGDLPANVMFASDGALSTQGCVVDSISHICSGSMTGSDWEQYRHSSLWMVLDKSLQLPYHDGSTWGRCILPRSAELWARSVRLFRSDTSVDQVPPPG
jgi:hypothetical protein